MKRRSFVALSAVDALASPAWAQGSYPDKPITMVVPAPPGGGTDLIARLYSDLLSQELGQQVIVDNKGGGNGNVGTAIVARARPDGYTLLMQYSAYHSANPALIKELNWKPEDFAGVAMGAVAPHVIVIAKKVPADDLKGFIAYAKANPGKLNYASVGARLGAASGRRAAEQGGRHRPHPCALQGRGTGDGRSRGRPGRADGGHAALGVGPYPQRHREGAGAGERPAPSGVRRHPDHGRSGPARLHPRRLVRPVRAGRHAAADHRQAERRDAQDRQDGHHQGARQPARHRAEGLDARPRWTSSPGAKSPTGAR